MLKKSKYSEFKKWILIGFTIGLLRKRKVLKYYFLKKVVDR